MYDNVHTGTGGSVALHAFFLHSRAQLGIGLLPTGLTAAISLSGDGGASTGYWTTLLRPTAPHCKRIIDTH